MNSKRRVVCFSVIFVLAVALLVTTLIIPMVHVVACDSGKNPIFDGTVNLIEYTREQIFLKPGVDGMYFSATGPLWLAPAGIMFNYLVVLMCGILAVVCVFELATSKCTKMLTRQNMFAKKLAKFVALSSLLIYVFQLVCFIVTNMMSGGYAVFDSQLQIYLGLGLSFVLTVFAFAAGKKQKEQKVRKTKNAFGFLYTALFAGATAGVMFLPVYADIYLGEAELKSVFGLARNANMFVGSVPAMGDLPIGITFYALIALGVCCAFVFVYSLIGFFLALAGKKANWLSRAVKNWSVLLLIASMIVNVLILTTASVLASAAFIDENIIFTPLAAVMFVAPYFTLLFSNMIAHNKKQKPKKEPAQQEVEQQAEQQA